MKYYLAPLEGITGYIYRNTYEKYFHNIYIYKFKYLLLLIIHFRYILFFYYHSILKHHISTYISMLFRNYQPYLE